MLLPKGFLPGSQNHVRVDHPLLRKLEHAGGLSGDDHDRLCALFTKTRRIPSREDIVLDGDGQNNVHLIMEGMACRYKLMPGGKRAIIAYLVPGDLCDLQHMVLGKMDHAIATVTPCVVAEASRAELDELCHTQSFVCRAMWRTTLVDEAVLRAWLSGLGQMPADKLLACLFCELKHRLDIVGLVEDGTTLKLGITQEDIGDTLGITAVHVNRLMQQLRTAGLIEYSSKSLVIPDLDRLELFAEFDAAYLYQYPAAIVRR